MFVGRETELNILNNLYLKDQFELVIITGRKRTGKTRLLSEYIKDKPGIFFTAIEGNKKLNLKILSKAIQDFENSTSFPPTFDSFSIALNNIFELSLTERFVFIIDEFPYLAQSDPSFSSLLQMMIDKYREKSKMMIILFGSSISFMENKVIAYKAPLYGRLTTQIKLKPLSFAESLPYFKNDNIEKVTYYGIYGGTPYYLNQINRYFKWDKMDISLSPNG